jgi:hypothetical protein
VGIKFSRFESTKFGPQDVGIEFSRFEIRYQPIVRAFYRSELCKRSTKGFFAIQLTLKPETHPHKLHCDQFESLGFETLDDVADETALDSIGLDHQEATFCVRHVWGDINRDAEKKSKNVELTRQEFSVIEKANQRLKRHLNGGLGMCECVFTSVVN